jgi:hypothetical protein
LALKTEKYEPGRIEAVHDEKHLNDVDGDADNFLTKCGLGATTETNGSHNGSHKN